MSSAGRIVPRMSKSKLREKRGQVVCQTWRILRGDTVYINTGKDKGLTGTVTKVRHEQRPEQAEFSRPIPLAAAGEACLGKAKWRSGAG